MTGSTHVPLERIASAILVIRARFPSDFMFRLTEAETANLKSQIATSSSGWGGRRRTPQVFTEHGAVMLASVLRSRIAVAASIQVVRAFVQLRGLVVTHTTLGRRLDELEQKYDRQFKAVFDALRELMAAPDPPRKRIGFQARDAPKN